MMSAAAAAAVRARARGDMSVPFVGTLSRAGAGRPGNGPAQPVQNPLAEVAPAEQWQQEREEGREMQGAGAEDEVILSGILPTESCILTSQILPFTRYGLPATIRPAFWEPGRMQFAVIVCRSHLA